MTIVLAPLRIAGLPFGSPRRPLSSMTLPIAPCRRLAALAVVLVLFSVPPGADAQSRRDKANIDTLTRNMQDAVARHHANDAAAGGDALRDMEAVIAACGRQRGCDVGGFLRMYRDALQADAGNGVGDGGDDPIDFTADDVPEAASADALLDERNRRFAQAVQFNPAVQSGIRRWLTDMRPSLMQSYENYQYMRHLMLPAFQQRGLPEALLFGILAKESNGKVHVGSRAGAVGPLQFMPATGRRFGLGLDTAGFDTRYDPRASSEAAAAYLLERYAQLDSSIEMSLAAYNGGEGRALRAYQGSGGRNFWDYDVYNQFPVETRDYVPMVIAAAWLYLHPKDYGLRFPRVASRPAALRLQQPTSIYELTICLGNTSGNDGFMRALRNLNPRYQPESWLPAGTTLNATTQIARLYNRHCTGGARAQLAKQLVASDPSLAVVRVGDMTTVQSVVPGQEPVARQVHVPGQGTVKATVATGVPVKASAPQEHRVASGDTLVSIARKYQCDTGALAKANDIKGPRFAIRPGQKLRLEACAR